MTTVNHGIYISETSKRFREVVLTGTRSIPDVDYSTKSKRKLERGEAFTLQVSKLFACSINGIKILIRITVGGETIELPISSNISIPVEGDPITIEIENPTGNTITAPALVEYITI